MSYGLIRVPNVNHVRWAEAAMMMRLMSSLRLERICFHENRAFLSGRRLVSRATPQYVQCYVAVNCGKWERICPCGLESLYDLLERLQTSLAH